MPPPPRHRPSSSRFANKRTAFQREADMAMAARLYCEHRTLAEIADAIKATRPYSLSVTQVHSDIQTVIERLQEEQSRSVLALRAKELLAINRVEAIAYELLLKERVRTTTERTTDGQTLEKAAKAAGMHKAKVVREPAAASAYLQIILQCIKQRRELLGLDVPDRTEISGPGGDPIQVQTYDDQLLKAYGIDRSELPATPAGTAGRPTSFPG